MSRSPARLGLVALATGAVLLLLPGSMLAAEPSRNDSVVFKANADVTVPAGTQRDVVIAIDGDAAVGGQVGTLVVVDGTATLTGAHVDTLIVAGGSADVDATSVVQTVRTFDSVYHAAPGATVGSHDTFQPELFAAALAPLAIALWLGFALAYLVAGLVVAAIGGRQLRQAGASLTGEPAAVLLAAVGLLVGLPVLFGLLMITVVGIPVGLAGLLVVLPMLWFVGSVAVAVRIGDWVLFQLRGRTEASHPLVAATIGLVVIGIVSVIPVVGFLVGLAGAGAAFLVAWRAAFAGGAPRTTSTAAGRCRSCLSG